MRLLLILPSFLVLHFVVGEVQGPTGGGSIPMDDISYLDGEIRDIEASGDWNTLNWVTGRHDGDGSWVDHFANDAFRPGRPHNGRQQAEAPTADEWGYVHTEAIPNTSELPRLLGDAWDTEGQSCSIDGCGAPPRKRRLKKRDAMSQPIATPVYGLPPTPATYRYRPPVTHDINPRTGRPRLKPSKEHLFRHRKEAMEANTKVKPHYRRLVYMPPPIPYGAHPYVARPPVMPYRQPVPAYGHYNTPYVPAHPPVYAPHPAKYPSMAYPPRPRGTVQTSKTVTRKDSAGILPGMRSSVSSVMTTSSSSLHPHFRRRLAEGHGVDFGHTDHDVHHYPGEMDRAYGHESQLYESHPQGYGRYSIYGHPSHDYDRHRYDPRHGGLEDTDDEWAEDDGPAGTGERRHLGTNLYDPSHPRTL